MTGLYRRLTGDDVRLARSGNGGPRAFLSLVIECPDPDFRPGTVSKWLEGRLPTPVDDLAQWEIDDGEADE